MSLSAFLKSKGIQVRLLISSSPKEIASEIRGISPHLVGFNCSTTEMPWVLQTANMIKSKFRLPVLLGGIHPTIDPEIISNRDVDYICRGEGEFATYELLRKLENHESTTKIKNIWAKKNGKIFRNPLREPVENLDQLPFPDRSIYDKYPQIRKSTFAGFVVGRGCPFRCTFCYTNYLSKIYHPYRKYVRLKSFQYLLAEIKRVISRYNIKTIHFYDSIFPTNSEWLDAFLAEYRKTIKIPFTVNLRADTLNESYVRKLCKSGCIGVAFGVESGNETIRNKILNKNISNHTFLKCAKLLRKLNMKMLTFNMMAIPTETLDDAIETVLFNAKIKPNYTLCTFLHPFPNLELTNFAENKNLVNTSNLMTGYSKPSPLIKVEQADKFIKLNSLFFLFVSFRMPRSIIKLFLNIFPMRLCTFFGKYNQYCHWRFHKLPMGEVKYHFNNINQLGTGIRI